MSTPTRKAAEPRCFCTRSAEEHPTSECPRYQPRPCVCGHPYSTHASRCQAGHDPATDKVCTCPGYREDGTPEFLLRAGIRAGEWGFCTLAQWRALMRPGNLLKTRIYACGMSHTIAHRRRMAMKLDSQGKLVSLTLTDIVDELNTLDAFARVSVGNASRAMTELERDGLARRTGPKAKNRSLFFYLRPLSKRSVPDPQVSNLVIIFDNQESAIDTNHNHLADISYLHFQGILVKTFFAAIRKTLEPEAGLVIKSDNQEKILSVLAPALEVVKFAYHQALKVMKSDNPYKEVSITSKEELQQSVSQSMEAETDRLTDSPPPPPEPEPLSDKQEEWSPILEAFEELNVLADDAEAQRMISACREAAPELRLEVPEIAAAVVQRGAKLSPKVVYPVRFLAKDIPKYVQTESFRRLLLRSRAAAALPRFDADPPPLPAEDRVINSWRCRDCGGLVEECESGRIVQCACVVKASGAS